MSRDAQQMMQIKLEAFDHRLIDRAVSDIMFAVNATGVSVHGPIPLPTKREIIVVNRSTHVDKASRQKFEMRRHYRLIIIEPRPQAVDSLMKLELPSGVNVKIKLLGKGL